MQLSTELATSHSPIIFLRKGAGLFFTSGNNWQKFRTHKKEPLHYSLLLHQFVADLQEKKTEKNDTFHFHCCCFPSDACNRMAQKKQRPSDRKKRRCGKNTARVVVRSKRREGTVWGLGSGGREGGTNGILGHHSATPAAQVFSHTRPPPPPPRTRSKQTDAGARCTCTGRGGAQNDVKIYLRFSLLPSSPSAQVIQQV